LNRDRKFDFLINLKEGDKEFLPLRAKINSFLNNNTMSMEKPTMPTPGEAVEITDVKNQIESETKIEAVTERDDVIKYLEMVRLPIQKLRGFISNALSNKNSEPFLVDWEQAGGYPDAIKHHFNLLMNGKYHTMDLSIPSDIRRRQPKTLSKEINKLISECISKTDDDFLDKLAEELRSNESRIDNHDYYKAVKTEYQEKALDMLDNIELSLEKAILSIGEKAN
jgi:hypothetical protein